MVTAERLHPAQARRLAARMPPAPADEIRLQPLGGGDGRSIVVTSAAEDFLAKLFEDLQAPDWRDRLSAMSRRRVAGDGVLGLGQPVHRRFHVALFEAWCDRPGRPRLDPARIAGSGLVVRRVRDGARAGWMRRGQTIDGWTALPRPDLDPDPAFAASPHPANAAILTAIAARRGEAQVPLTETIHALYPAPPEVCAALRRTVLFAVVPVVSTEVAERPGPALDYRALAAAERKEIVDHFSEYLKARPERPLPRAGEPLDAGWNALDAATAASDPRLGSLATFLYQAMVELDALGAGRAAGDLRRALSGIHLPTAQDRLGRVTATVDAATFVHRAGPVLVGRENNRDGFRMPLRWPAVDAPTGAGLIDAALACLSEQHRARIGPPGKFADDDARYVVRGFLRVSGHPGCPGRLVWSMESEPFRILPWWDGDGPGTTVTLPDLANLKKVRPSVAFAMPPVIANLLKGDMKKLADGEGDTGGPQIAWICSFSIPFITLCAFIVLNIFLTLFDLIFRWLLFIKICLPVPKPPPPPGGGSG